MTNKLFLIFCLSLVASNTIHKVDGMKYTLEEDLEFERQLKLINKTPIKTIHTKSGQIVDCIDIKNQPAFDHPLLQNHKLQRKPSFKRIMGKNIIDSSLSKPVFGLEKNQCPTGTIPIRRTTKDDLIRSKSIVNYHDLAQGIADVHNARVVLTSTPKTGYYYGVRGSNNIYNPRVNKNQQSVSHMWVQNGLEDDMNAISVGWQVSPDLYGDDHTYLFTFWTSDNSKKTGCYNLLCQGFVQIDTQYYIGVVIDETSVYGGRQNEMTVSLSKDNVTKNWWVIINDRNVGYFPATLFSNLNSASLLGWGGRTATLAGTPSPPMGSGNFPDDNFVHACYFRNVAYQDESRKYYKPDDYLVRTFTDKPNCFGVEYYGDQGGQFGSSLQFGGPGGQCGN